MRSEEKRMREEIIKTIMNYVNTEAEITREAELAADLGLNSLDAVSMVTEFEDKFNIEIPDRDIKKLVTVGDIEDYLNEKIQQ